jgi:hypothetical protein
MSSCCVLRSCCNTRWRESWSPNDYQLLWDSLPQLAACLTSSCWWSGFCCSIPWRCTGTRNLSLGWIAEVASRSCCRGVWSIIHSMEKFRVHGCKTQHSDMQGCILQPRVLVMTSAKQNVVLGIGVRAKATTLGTVKTWMAHPQVYDPAYLSNILGFPSVVIDGQCLGFWCCNTSLTTVARGAQVDQVFGHGRHGWKLSQLAHVATPH